MSTYTDDARCQQEKCPKCGEYTVYYDSYFKAYCCSRFSCTYFERRHDSSRAPVAVSPNLDTVRVVQAIPAPMKSRPRSDRRRP